MNVILFLVDDWGWTDGGVLGSDLYETPHIDRLASEGVRFTQGYAACTVCSPTRAAIMTGLYPARLHLTDWIAGHSTRFENTPLLEPDWNQKLDHAEVTIAEVLREHGYRTAHIGKWHLTPKVDPVSAEETAYWPERQGFEVNIGGNQFGAPGSYFAPYSRGDRFMGAMPQAEDGEYLTTALTDEAVQIIENWKDERFFIYFPFYNVHTPVQAEQKWIDHYTPKVEEGMRHTNPTYAGMVSAIDTAIGRVMAVLEENGIAERTVIILTGDNGGLDPEDKGSITNNAPLRDGKGSVYEGGVRVPFIAKSPGGAKGRVSEVPVISNDCFPTILSLLRLENPVEVDGIDLSPILTGEAETLEPRELYWHYPHYHTQGATPYSAVRSGDFRLIEYHLDGSIELYNLEEDIGETENLAEEEPALAGHLLKKLQAWRESVGAQYPSPNPAYDPSSPTLKPGYSRKR